MVLVAGDDRRAKLKPLLENAWMLDTDRDSIRKCLEFDDFTDAFAFMTKIALKSERIGHHPEWSNIRNKVHIALISHSSNGLTEKDIILANFIDQSYSQFRPAAKTVVQSTLPPPESQPSTSSEGAFSFDEIDATPKQSN